VLYFYNTLKIILSCVNTEYTGSYGIGSCVAEYLILHVSK